ncbi:WGR domain-containing protein (plasmid) [Aneurinibacillus sp. Ricciae_BoGa-3]|uniref:WGR domain-containing protein n=1 Tax=Aneurinibacillus sp. Ricciae_BoGa-3 TaxID=3022697 RepID=UPI00233FFBCE|nr:WGR domain-containing protein [Aneurinibacillus sp. Ricciae_BoGa-3]WCK57307.1 WGR domain-containing protein [Aneurinibacillus sp. Ricciae_BoGa-3]
MAKAVAINSVQCPTFNVSRVAERVVLNYASLQDNSNKFYIAELQEGSGVYPYRIYTEYGRMGKNPRKEGRFFHSRWEADSEFQDILSSKQAKGYEKIDVDDGFSFSPSTSVKVTTKAPKQNLTNINDKVLKLIGKLYQEATGYLVSSIQTPLGKLTSFQVSKGLEILNKIEELLDKGSHTNLDYYSNQFYSIIPVIFGTKVDYRKFIIDDYIKLNDKKDLLGVMSSVVKVQNDLEKTLEEKYKALNIKLKSLSSRTKEYKHLVEFIKNSQGHNHHFKINVQDIFQVEDMVGFDKFNPYNVSTMELFHGSRNENILSIMQNGLKIKPKSAVHTGSMFGSGIYFADQSSKSANYCWGFNNGAGSDSYYLFVCDVATGKIKEYEDAQPHLTTAPRPYNSVLGKKGRSLIHNEYIVYKDSQVKIKYIVEFKKA